MFRGEGDVDRQTTVSRTVNGKYWRTRSGEVILMEHGLGDAALTPQLQLPICNEMEILAKVVFMRTYPQSISVQCKDKKLVLKVI